MTRTHRRNWLVGPISSLVSETGPEWAKSSVVCKKELALDARHRYGPRPTTRAVRRVDWLQPEMLDLENQSR